MGGLTQNTMVPPAGAAGRGAGGPGRGRRTALQSIGWIGTPAASKPERKICAARAMPMLSSKAPSSVMGTAPRCGSWRSARTRARIRWSR